MINISIIDEYKGKLEEEPLRLTALTVLAHQGKSPDTEVNIVITDIKTIKKLNKEYRGYNEATDVLSFESGVVDPETEVLILGDIIISYPTAKENAKEHKNDELEEIQLLVAHGCLHLLGFDHDNEDNKQKMWRAQDEILSTINVKARP